jgi:hypothetical protein
MAEVAGIESAPRRAPNRSLAPARRTLIDALAFDLNNFIQDAVKGGYAVKDTMFLSVLFAGFELWRGGDQLLMWQYCANVL